MELITRLIPTVCVIIVFAYILTRTRFFNEILEHKFTFQNRLILILACGIFSIYGTLGGIDILGGIANMRDLGPAIAGLLAGPIAGVAAGLIGGIHRYCLGGFTMIPCSSATILSGFLGGLVFLVRKKEVPSVTLSAGFAAGMELVHMGMVLLLGRPYPEAMAIVKAITIPMVLANTLGMGIFFFIVNNLMRELETKTEKDMIEGELRGAREIQMSIVPQIYPAFPDLEKIDLCARLIPAKEVGGDLYDYYLLDKEKNKLFFMIGDVSDKGVPASLFMIITMTLFKANTSEDADLAQIVKAVNNQLAVDNDANMFVTLFCGVMNVSTGDIHYVNAGHNPPLLVRKGDAPEFIPSSGDLVLGAMPGIDYSARGLTLAPGDTLLLYTDGVTEAFNTGKELFSEERLVNVAAHINSLSANDGVEAVYQAVTHFAGDATQSDDITLLLLRYREGIND
ncbi:MAG: SpoIIE family protein phosphatase [Thermodesulfobacteriota bacterium]|nr:SpoIIE family protein phosphatase [Thermodesulfobacteriota bacterium]